MYLHSLDHFRHALEQQLEVTLEPSRPLAEGLLDFYTRGIDLYLTGGNQPRGCLAICTASAEAVEEPEIRLALAGILEVIDTAFDRRFKIAMGASDNSQSPSAEQMASMASATLHSLAVRARAGQDREKLVALAQATATTLANLVEADKASQSQKP